MGNASGRRLTREESLSLSVLAIFWPPVAVLLLKGWGRDLAKNVLLTLLGFYPGVIHATRLIAEAEARSGETLQET